MVVRSCVENEKLTVQYCMFAKVTRRNESFESKLSYIEINVRRSGQKGVKMKKPITTYETKYPETKKCDYYDNCESCNMCNQSQYTSGSNNGSNNSFWF